LILSFELDVTNYFTIEIGFTFGGAKFDSRIIELILTSLVPLEVELTLLL